MNDQLIDVNYQFHICKNGNEKFDIDLQCREIYDYHKVLWQRKLPNGKMLHFEIRKNRGGYYLFEMNSKIRFGSDSILHTYRNYSKGKIKNLIKEFNQNDLNQFYEKLTTIGGYIIFPKHMNSLNQRRGNHSLVADRFDITLDSIRKYYRGEKIDYPLRNDLEKDREFFSWFIDFESYVSFFYLDDLVDKKSRRILFFSEDKPLPTSKASYLIYKANVLSFLEKRNRRIHKEVNS